MADLIDRDKVIEAIDDMSVEVDEGYGFQYEKWRKYFCELPGVQRLNFINTDGLEEEIRCTMCKNPMRTDRGCDGGCKYDEKLYADIMKVLNRRINDLPSVQPDKNLSSYSDKLWKLAYEQGKAEAQPRKGKWEIYATFDDCYYAKCNQCHETQVFYYNKQLTNFCPNCGADMRDKYDE